MVAVGAKPRATSAGACPRSASIAAAAAFAMLMFSGGRPSNPMPGVTHSVAAEDELIGPGDATELVDDLDLDELKAVDNHFNGGV